MINVSTLLLFFKAMQRAIAWFFHVLKGLHHWDTSIQLTVCIVRRVLKAIHEGVLFSRLDRLIQGVFL